MNKTISVKKSKVRINSPQKYLIKYQSKDGPKIYRLAPIEVTAEEITGYVYKNVNTEPGIRTFKCNKIEEIEKLSRA